MQIRALVPVVCLAFATQIVAGVDDAHSARIVLYDLEGTLLPPSDERKNESAWLQQAPSWVSGRLAAHLGRLRAIGVTPVGLPSSRRSWDSDLAIAGLSGLLGDRGALKMPEVLGSFGIYGGIQWSDRPQNETAVNEQLAQNAIYVGRNSFLVDRIVRHGWARHAVWVADRLTARDEVLIETMAADLDSVQRCHQPAGDPTWSDFLCCSHAQCNVRQCCMPSLDIESGKASASSVLV